MRPLKHGRSEIQAQPYCLLYQWNTRHISTVSVCPRFGTHWDEFKDIFKVIVSCFYISILVNSVWKRLPINRFNNTMTKMYSDNFVCIWINDSKYFAHCVRLSSMLKSNQHQHVSRSTGIWTIIILRNYAIMYLLKKNYWFELRII